MPVRTPFYQVKMGCKNVTLEGAGSGVDITPWISAVTVVEDDRQADNVTLTIPDPRLIYADALFEGSYVAVDIGYAEPNQHAFMLRALITKVELSYPQNGIPTLTLKGEDKSILMGLKEKRKVWRNQTVTAIVREVARSYGFASVEAQLNPDPEIRSHPINQDGKTDLAFLQDLAKRYHAKCFVELDEQGREVLYFIPDRRIVQLRRPDQLILQYRNGSFSNLVSFSPSFDSSYIDRLKEINDVDHRGNRIQSQERQPTEEVLWSLDDQLPQASESDRSKIRTLYKQGVDLKKDLQKQLTARRAVSGAVAADRTDLESTNDSLESRRQGMTANGSTFGNIWLRAKSKITIVGANPRFNGEWYVSNVTHKIDSSGGYKTDFRCVR
ncbi:MAG TPA: contractile injection system protein, VgrG/Pvc8 family [Stenomitos sp.]